jgi:hypothetical protein
MFRHLKSDFLFLIDGSPPSSNLWLLVLHGFGWFHIFTFLAWVDSAPKSLPQFFLYIFSSIKCCLHKIYPKAQVILGWLELSVPVSASETWTHLIVYLMYSLDLTIRNSKHGFELVWTLGLSTPHGILFILKWACWVPCWTCNSSYLHKV